MLTIFKLWHDHKNQLVKTCYDKYENGKDSIGNPPSNV